jgi:hypothetical protein
MNAYTELKDSFDHLQKRALDLFAYGQKREAVLKEAVVIAWKQFERLGDMNDASDMRIAAYKAKCFMEGVLEKHKKSEHS